MFNFFKKKEKKPPKDLKELFQYLEKLEEDYKKISQEIENLKEKSKFSIQKIGLVRFNPFSEIGGDQSFSVALLDSNNDGVVITSLYSRGNNRTYGKSIKNSQSEHQLSDEEKKVIAEAINKNIQ